MFVFLLGPYKMLRKLHKLLTTKSNADIVTIANALFPKEGFSINEDFLTANRENFMCESQNLDYSDPQTAAHAINEWVKNKTKGTASFRFVLKVIKLLKGVVL